MKFEKCFGEIVFDELFLQFGTIIFSGDTVGIIKKLPNEIHCKQSAQQKLTLEIHAMILKSAGGSYGSISVNLPIHSMK